MKIASNKNARLSFICALALLGAVSAASFSLASSREKIPTVQISVKRMTVDEKIAYDTAGLNIPTVMLTARRLSSEQKLAMDSNNPATKQGLAQRLAKWRQHG